MTLRSNIDERQILVKLILYQDSLILKKTTGNEDLIIAGVNEDITMIQEDTMRQLPVSKKDIQIMTREDSELKELSEIIKKGFWPKVKPGSNWNAFQSKAADLTLHDGILFMGVRAVIPKKLQQRILRMLHQGHPGITRMKMLARQSVYWHGIDKDVESMVKSCDACQKQLKGL